MPSILLRRHADPYPSRQTFFGSSVYGREGRRVGAVRVTRAGRSNGNSPYAIVELAGFSKASSDLRAVPLETLSYVEARGHFLCSLSERALRGAPAYSGAADWLDDRWTRALDGYFDSLSVDAHQRG